MIIIEFCGAPGVGKTSQSKALLKYFTEKEYTAIDYMMWYFSDTSILGRVTRKMRNILKYFTREAFRIYVVCLKNRCLWDNPNKKYWIARILEAYLCIRSCKRKNFDILIFDEGVIQYITSIFHEKNIKMDDLNSAKILLQNNICDEKLIINCLLDFEENVNRLIERHRSGDRFIGENDSQIKRMLDLKIDNINKVLALADSNKIFSVNVSHFDNAQQLIREYVSNR